MGLFSSSDNNSGDNFEEVDVPADEFLKMSIEQCFEKSGVHDLQEAYEDLESQKEEFDELGSGKFQEAVREVIADHYDGKTTIDKEFTIKKGSVYKYSSSTEADINHITRELDRFEELSEETREVIREVSEEVNQNIGDQIDQTARTLMDDDRDFDAAKIYVSYRKIKLSLVDIGESRSCSGDTIYPNKEARDQKVKELMKLIEYQPELLEIVDEMKERVAEANGDRAGLYANLHSQSPKMESEE